MNNIRNLAHYIVLGFIPVYSILYWLNVNFSEIERIVFSVIVGAFLGWVNGFVWENIQRELLKAVYDNKDVLRTCAGGLIAGILFAVFPKLGFIPKYLFWANVAPIVYSIYKGIALILYRRKINKNNQKPIS